MQVIILLCSLLSQSTGIESSTYFHKCALQFIYDVFGKDMLKYPILQSLKVTYNCAKSDCIWKRYLFPNF